MYDALRSLVQQVAPRKDHIDVEPGTDLGFGGYGMTIIEYLVLLDRIESDHGGLCGDVPWPHTLEEIIGRTELS